MPAHLPNPLPIRAQIANGIRRVFTVLEDYDPQVRDLILAQLEPEVSVRLLEAIQATDREFYRRGAVAPLWSPVVPTADLASNAATPGS